MANALTFLAIGLSFTGSFAVLSCELVANPQDAFPRAAYSKQGDDTHAIGSVAENGYIYATVQVNDEPVRFLVDTGANTIVLRQSDAVRAGVTRMGKVEMQTVGGPVMATYSRIATLELNEAKLTDLNAVTVNDSLETSLIGMEALSQMGPIHFANGKLHTSR